MRKEAVAYWDSVAARSEADAQDAVLAGFRTKREFDDSGRVDAAHLVLPFVSSSDAVLDLGCGLGRLTKWTSPACRDVLAVDISTEMLRRARVNLAGFKNVRFRRLPRSLRIPTPDRSIDFLLYYHVSEHLEREDNLKILKEIKRCLRRTGRALVEMSLYDHPDNRREFLKWARLGSDEGVGVRSRFYTEEEARMMLSLAGLHPQLRLYVPGKFVVVVTPRGQDLLGAMPLVRIAPAELRRE